MILFNATSRRACALSDDKLTTGSVGIPVEFTFSDDWTAAPARIAVFRGSGVSVDVALLEDSCTVPPEVLTQPGSTLTIGVYGTDGAGTVVIPTVYAEAGRIARGAEPSGIEPTPQTQPLIDQLLAAAKAARDAADEAERLAQSVRDNADAGEFDGEDGNGIWRTVSRITSTGVPGYGEIRASYLKGRSGTPAAHDLVIGPAIGDSGSIAELYEISSVATGTCALKDIGSLKGAPGAPGAPGDPGADGYAPEVTIEQIDGGHRVTITSADYPEGQSFDVVNGAKGPQGKTGPVGPQGPGVTEDLRAALLQLAQKVAYVDEHGADYYQDLYDALYPSAALLSISATFTQGSTVVYDDSDLDDLRTMLYVVGHYDDNTDAEVTNYTLSGNLTTGTSTVNVSYLGKTTTFTVTVTARPTLSSISAVYTQGGTVLETDSLDSLKTDLVVTATYSDSSTETVPASDYTLSGTLTAGTSTITVSYSGLTTTFTVTVTAGTEILTTSTYKTSVTGGTWVSSTPPFRATTSGTAGWNITITPNTTGLPSPKISDMLGHKCRLVVTSDWASSVAGSNLDVAIMGTSSNDGSQQRGAFKIYVIKPDSPRLDVEFVVSQEYFTSDTSKYNANHYFSWRAYVYSNAGADVTFDVHLYDLGLEA